MPSNSQKIWYFAYGSNMSRDKFTGHRGITPLCSARVYLPNWVLSMEIPGVPYSEPCYGTIHRRDESRAERGSLPDVTGVAYLITAEQYRTVLASEGGQIAYQDVSVLAKPVSKIDEWKIGFKVNVRTLASSGIVRWPPLSPSGRYIDLLMTGAREVELPPAYIEYLDDISRYIPPTTWWTKFGALMFLGLTQPVWVLLDKLTHSLMKEDGTVPESVVVIVRTAIGFIWVVHDLFFAPVFGRGDGVDQQKHHPAGLHELRHQQPNTKGPNTSP